MINRTRSVWSIAIAGALALSSCDVFMPARCDLSMLDRIEIERVMDDLEYLTVDIGPRLAASQEEAKAAEFIAGVFEEYGYEVEIQEFPTRGMISGRLDILEPEPQAINITLARERGVDPVDHILVGYGEVGVTGRVVEAGEGGPDDFPEDVSGQIALVERSDLPIEDVVSNAANAGATALLIANNTWRRYRLTLPGSPPIPIVTMGQDNAERLRAAGPQMVRLSAHYGEGSQNVIATRKVPGQPDAPIVIFTAHYDSVEEAPGASDNASGTVAIMELARLYSRVPVGVELRFAAVGAEEIGLVGSRYYVRELPEEERARIVANYNMDMVATASEEHGQLRAGTVDGEDNLVTLSAKAALQVLEYPDDMLHAPRRGGGSDHVPFHGAGIPAAAFAYHHPETGRLEPWYHTPRDEFERICPDRLQTAIRMVATASMKVACEDGPMRPGVEVAVPDN